MTTNQRILAPRWGRISAEPGKPISTDDLRSHVPAIFADHPHAKRSSAYGLVSTAKLLAQLLDNGFVISHAAQLVSRHQSDRNTAKHLVRLQHPGHRPLAARTLGEVWPELVVRNSHDGTTKFHMQAGLFRLACLNGLVVPDGTVAEFETRHHQSAADVVIDGAFEVLEESTKAIATATVWSERILTDLERSTFAEMARTLRLSNRDGSVTSPVSAERFLMPRRYGDNSHDLWTTFNVIQENTIRGGIVGAGRMIDGRERRVTTRPIYAIDRERDINEALWSHAASLVEA